MLQLKDTAIKLFGKTIPCCASAVADGDEFGGGSCSEINDRGSSSTVSEIGAKEMEKISQVRTVKGIKQQGEDESVDGSIMLETNENQKTPSVNVKTVNANAGSGNVTEEGNLKEKTLLKKPDKLLPCPRCNSMDTKFCYYNNYNVLQPRHFCKGCQRYWTAGGAMRNVPVGAGRRKGKNTALRYLTVSEILQASAAGSPNGLVPGHPGLKCGSVLLTARSDATVSASTGSVSNLRQMPFLDPAQMVNKLRRDGEIISSGSCITASNETESKQHGQTSLAPSFNGCLTQIPSIPTWPYPWNAVTPPPAFPHPGFAVTCVPPSYWPCPAIPNTLNAPWLSPQSQTSTNVGGIINSKPPVLGKHSRDGEMVQSKDNLEKPETRKQPLVSVLTPKALRIDHPEEASKSSIWETLGIKNEILSKGGLFRDLKSKEGDKIKNVPENYAHLTANPAALSRSLNFQEVS
ncbi:hypothetical protein QQ045_032996 [Rhodiola kirilowii]